jgi:transcriptional regulator with XRE-family HTH domain
MRLWMQRFGEKLRALRTRQGRSVRALANALGYTAYSYISEIETGKLKPSIEFALKVARLFDVTTDQLLKDELELDTDA